MEVQQLRAWRSVVATGSVRAAAEMLGYSPSAVSQQVSGLQRAAGVPLLTRVGRGIEPTPEGLALARRIDGVLGELSVLEDYVRGLREGRDTTATIGYFASLGTTWMPDILARLAREHPETQLELFVADSFDAARHPRPDLQLVVLPDTAHAPPGYRAHLLAEDEYAVVMPAGHPLAASDRIPLSTLSEYDWIDNDVAGGSCRQTAVDAAAAAGFQPVFRVQTPDYPSALALVARGIGISVMPSLAARSLPHGAVARPITSPTPVRTIYALTPAASDALPVARRALELAVQAAGPNTA
ncbi:LysR family transcriptional regulator [Brevibacterium album]|uniref:LysR family transcriptional regulator n=1 Tax=Brevibacterium album TaxID=417948 RepID=UPI0003FCCE53|nr:LysR family transcriptional regulator [Brevibacterium album]